MAIVYLIGPRASGKTTVGALLARRMHCFLGDTDHYLREVLRCTIAEFVEANGWPAFRDAEREAMRAITLDFGRTGTAVISTGGGIVLKPNNCEYMRENGIVFYLKAPVDVLAARLAANPEAGQRPSLTGKDPVAEIADVLKEREPLYQACAHHVLDATQAPDMLCKAMLALLPDGD